MAWQSYTAHAKQHTVTGDLRVYPALYSPQLDNQRDVLVWLPPSYGDSRRYPVIYMHDGQNLFDAHTSYSGEWRVDETMLDLCREGYEAIIVGLPNQGEKRTLEYNPYPATASSQSSGRGDDYIRFITDTVKPLIDQTFNTLPAVETTGIAGSSMGGLISLYGFLTRPNVFGLCGCFSPAFWFGSQGLHRTIDQYADGHGRIYLDVGTHEGHIFQGRPAGDGRPMTAGDRRYVEGARQLRQRLAARGYQDGVSLLYVEEAGATHHEDAWARRLPAAFRFLLAD